MLPKAWVQVVSRGRDAALAADMDLKTAWALALRRSFNSAVC